MVKEDFKRSTRRKDMKGKDMKIKDMKKIKLEN